MKINIHFYIFMLFACCAFINDIIIYLFCNDYIISLLITISILLILNIIFIYKKVITIELNWNKMDIFAILFFVVYTIVSGIVYPEYTYDSVSYHIYLQKYFPIDKVNFDFFPVRIFCCFLFPLGDRMYYIIGKFCGLRFGTFLSFYTIVVVYYQSKKILSILTNNSKRVHLYSYLIYLTFVFIRNVGTYYIDNLALVFLLEVFYRIIYEKNLLKNKIELYLIMLISGISIGIKVTNAFFILVMFFYLIYKNRNNLKYLNLIDIIISILLITLPYFIYVIDNYKQVESILFPYYNTFFKSKYFGNYNWVDSRFGIKGIFSKVIWPIILGLKFGEYGDELIYYDPMFSVGFVVCCIYFIYNLIKKKNQVKNELIFLWFILDFVWIFVMYGYHRYGVFVIFLCNILFISILIDFIDSKKVYKENLLIYQIAVVTMIIVSLYEVIVYTDIDNLKYVFKDVEKDSSKIKIDGVWGAPYDSSCFVSLVRENDVPIYNLHKEYFEDSETSANLWNEKVLNTNEDIYTIIDFYGGKLEDCYRYKIIVQDGFYVEEVVDLYTPQDVPYINAHSVWLLVKLKPIEN